MREGLDNPEYKEYDTKGPGGANILAEQNAGNIAYLKQRVDELAGIKTTVDDLSQQVNQHSTQIQGLVQQQADYATQLAGDSPPTVTGT